MLTVSNLQEENRLLKEKIKELKSNQCSVTTSDVEVAISKELGDILSQFKTLHLKTYEGYDNKLRMESAILLAEHEGKFIEIKVYPNHDYQIRHKPGKRAWKSIELEKARKITKKWKVSETIFSFSKSLPDRTIQSHFSKDITPKQCAVLVFASS